MNNLNTFPRPFETNIEDSLISVKVTSEGLDLFNRAFDSPEKRALVRKIDFQVILPEIPHKRLRKVQSSREAQVNNEIVRNTVENLFSRLATWNTVNATDNDSPSGIIFTLNAVSPTDAWVKDQLEKGELPSRHKFPVYEGRFRTRYLSFSQELPKVACISEFSFSTRVGRLFHPDAVASIANALVSAKKMSWDFVLPSPRVNHYSRMEFASDQKTVRSALGDALMNTRFPSLCKFEVRLVSIDPLNELFEPEDMTDAEGGDRLSLGVRRILQLPTLESLRLPVIWVLGPSAFSGSDFHCPSIKDLYIDLSLTTPDGKWLYTGDSDDLPSDDEDYGSDDDNEAAFNSKDSEASDFYPAIKLRTIEGEIPDVSFRNRPNDEAFVPFTCALAAAVKNMPALRCLRVYLGGAVSTTIAPLDIRYFAPGEPFGEDLATDEKAFEKQNGTARAGT